MFDLKFHEQINDMLRFTPPQKRCAKSVQEALAMQKQRKRQNDSHRNDPLVNMEAVEELYVYVVEKYTAYFELDPSAHHLEWNSGSVFVGR